MHIPDGFIDVPVAVITAVLSATGVGYSLHRAKAELPPGRVPLLGLSAAFVFAAQMLNFPVAAGTSGHLIGASLVAILLGPFAAVIVMCSVLVLQSLMFADGGITALGANVFNMALLASGVGYFVYRILARGRGDLRRQLFAVAFASWASTVVASVSCAGQLALSGVASPGLVLTAMAGVHMLIGVGEAVITTLVISAILRVQPDLLNPTSARPLARAESLGYGALLSVGLLVFAAPFASEWPDGLEKVAAVLGFEKSASEVPVVSGPLADYAVSGVTNATLSTLIAGLLGTIVAFILSYLLARALTRGQKRPTFQGESP